jgi:hypothetical protein
MHRLRPAPMINIGSSTVVGPDPLYRVSLGNPSACAASKVACCSSPVGSPRPRAAVPLHLRQQHRAWPVNHLPGHFVSPPPLPRRHRRSEGRGRVSASDLSAYGHNLVVGGGWTRGLVRRRSRRAGAPGTCRGGGSATARASSGSWTQRALQHRRVVPAFEARRLVTAAAGQCQRRARKVSSAPAELARGASGDLALSAKASCSNRRHSMGGGFLARTSVPARSAPAATVPLVRGKSTPGGAFNRRTPARSTVAPRFRACERPSPGLNIVNAAAVGVRSVLDLVS